LNAAYPLVLCTHGVTWNSPWPAWIAAGVLLAAIAGFAQADPSPPTTSDPRVTPGQVIDGWGKPIPCRCRYGGRTYQLGETVCMNTPFGTRLARCELVLNNTSWVPTQDSCVISSM
jgi:hypothetical protein